MERLFQVASTGLDLRSNEEKLPTAKLVRVTHVMRLGTEDALKAALQAMGLSGRLNTAFIERVNLTVRHGVAALVRRSWATAQQSPQLLAHLECGVRTITLCVPMHRYEWRSCNRESEVASSFRNTIGNAPQPWPPAEPIADGRRAKYSRAPCQSFPLERHRSQIRLASSVTRKSGKVLVEALGGSLASERGGLHWTAQRPNPVRSWFEEG